MATSPGSRRSDTRNTVSGDPDPTPLNPMQEPLGSMERPISRTSDDNDVNLSSDGTRRTAGNLGTTGKRGRGRGFTTTFAIIAAVLVAAFLIALYLGSDRTNEATAPTTTPPPVAEAPATTDDTTGSTTTAPSQESAPATGTTGTGSGTTAPASP